MTDEEGEPLWAPSGSARWNEEEEQQFEEEVAVSCEVARWSDKNPTSERRHVRPGRAKRAVEAA
jgi:hypothetical protein